MKSTQEITRLENALKKLENLHASFDYLRIAIASPQRIKSWVERVHPTGYPLGEVTRPETINFRTHQPENDGLFCEYIFGPARSWRCRCGKYNGFAKDKICEDCKIEILDSRVRRYRMGYIDLTCPVVHFWYLKGNPSYLSIFLKCIKEFDDSVDRISDIEEVVYYKHGSEIIKEYNFLYKFFLKEKNELGKTFSTNYWNQDKKRRGAEIIKAALESIDLSFEIKRSRSLLDEEFFCRFQTKKLPDKRILRRIRLFESFLSTNTSPTWMVLTILPVLPPHLRPLIELEGGQLVAADLNELYRLIITRNNRLKDFLYVHGVPDLISIQGRKLLQDAVDALIDNSKLGSNQIISLNNKPLKSLTETLEGKEGRFRQSLLGKRVDYSGRSVIIVNPTLRLNQCGLPYEMATELFQPFLIHELLNTKIQPPSHNTKLAYLMIKKNKPFIWRLVEKLTRRYCVLLNRAPTLHKFGIQAFNPVLILGRAIHLHPLVCTGFNADFDGDQMAVHLPLYESSQLEAYSMMRPSSNIQSPSNGEVILKPTQDMVIGSYYLTLMMKKNTEIHSSYFPNEEMALLALEQKKVSIHTKILVRYKPSDFVIDELETTFSFCKKKQGIILGKKKITIFKIVPTKTSYLLLTNIGVFVANYLVDEKYQITSFFFETTPGRIIFHQNFENSLEKASQIHLQN
jgi:DNA-directed RNA polymerase subunit beta'